MTLAVTAPMLRQWLSRLLAYAVGLHGLLIIGTTLEDQLHVHMGRFGLHASGFVFSVPILLGLTLLYLGLLLRQRKRTAWAVALVVYAILLVLNIIQVSHFEDRAGVGWLILREIVPVLLIVVALVGQRAYYIVRSDITGFRTAVKFSALVLVAAFAYGVIGFSLLDQRDFHQDLSWAEAAHRTLDQFDLTTTNQLRPYTRRAHIFLDTLSVMSLGAFGYAVVSLFQPIRARFAGNNDQRELVTSLLERYPASSEDFFKLWPHDKLYFFNAAHTAGLAYGVRRGIALVVGDPFGNPAAFGPLLRSFEVFCQVNDWRPAFIHTIPGYNQLFERHDFVLQKLGEEAIVDLDHFEQHVQNEKYFRQIGNKFEKHGYTTEVCLPPHNPALIARLTTISNEWLKKPGREERGFMLGYFSADYMQQCPIMVLRDAAGTIQAFMNQVPSFDPEEANYDLLRYTQEALGNSNDYLLLQFIAYARGQGFKRLNLGLCMLAGIGDQDERSLIDNALHLLYAKGDRLFSFSGLYRFKSKYQPEWSSRYIAYRGRIGTFTRIATALNAAAKIKIK